jgi:hypothetical protein
MNDVSQVEVPEEREVSDYAQRLTDQYLTALKMAFKWGGGSHVVIVRMSDLGAALDELDRLRKAIRRP